MLDDQVRTADCRKPEGEKAGPLPAWHLDEMVCNVGGKRMYLWRAVDDEGEILDMAMRPLAMHSPQRGSWQTWFSLSPRG